MIVHVGPHFQACHVRGKSIGYKLLMMLDYHYKAFVVETSTYCHVDNDCAFMYGLRA